MSETQEATPETTEQRAGDEAPTGWHLYDGKEVTVQLFEPYLLGFDPQAGPQATPVLNGMFRITKGATEGSLLFVLNANAEGGDLFITMHPADVKHVTFVEKRERPRVISP